MKFLIVLVSLLVFSTSANATVILFKDSNTPEQNTEAWNDAVSRTKEFDVLAIPRGEFYHNGLVIDGKQHLQISTVIPGQTQGARLISVNTSQPSIIIARSRNIELSGLYFGHASPSSQAAIAFYNTGNFTVDKVSTWQETGKYSPANSMHGLVVYADAGAFGWIYITNSIFNSHPGDGIYLSATHETAILAELYLNDNVIMNNAGNGISVIDRIAGLYFSRNTMWDNGIAIRLISATDIFLNNNIIDWSRSFNILATDTTSGHLKSNWISWAQAKVNIQITGQGNAFAPWEISDNTILTSNGHGIVYGMGEARIHNNTVKGQAGTGITLTENSKDVSVIMNYFKGHSLLVNDLGTNNQILMNPIF
jgi:Right handed beta helix region